MGRDGPNSSMSRGGRESRSRERRGSTSSCARGGSTSSCARGGSTSRRSIERVRSATGRSIEIADSSIRKFSGSIERGGSRTWRRRGSSVSNEGRGSTGSSDRSGSRSNGDRTESRDRQNGLTSRHRGRSRTRSTDNSQASDLETSLRNLFLKSSAFDVSNNSTK